METLETLVPRAYQSEIFEKARDKNIICAMDTGSGKTLIAVLLIKWTAAKPENTDKKIVFLVPKVPLVSQQAKVLEDTTPLKVRGYWGELGVDTWDRTAWTTEFEKHDVLVMTAQIYYDVLLHGYWSMDRTSLIVFDEAHHCQKKHVYAKIMTDHYQRAPEADQPKILGLTASPIWNPKRPRLAIYNLEQAMDATIIAVTLNTEELSANVPKPNERVEIYGHSPDTYPGYLRPTLWEECDVFLRSLSSFDEHSKRIGRYEAILSAVGPYGADYWILHELKTAVRTAKGRYEAILADIARRRSDDDVAPPSSLQDAIEILEKHSPRFADDIEVQNHWLSPKMLKLVELLGNAKSRTDVFHGIVFTEQRGVAAAVSWILSRVPGLKDWAKCDVVMGHGTTSAHSSSRVAMDGMGFKSQHDVIAKFRSHELNLLVATNVAEEGLDFKACHIIVRFDPLRTFVGYVQSRGRARRVDSEYIIMISETPGPELAIYEEYRTVEPGLKRRYQTSINDAPPLLPEDEDGLEDEATLQEVFDIPRTGARLTSYGAIPLLTYLCTLIPRDGFSPLLQPKFVLQGEKTTWRCTITLPSALPLDTPERTFQGPIRRGKRNAKSSAAYMVMLKLVELRVFDDHLLPGQLQRGDNALDADDRPIPPVEGLLPIIEVDSFDALGDVRSDEVSSSWIHPILVEGVAATAFVTANEVPETESDFPLIGAVTKRIKVKKGAPYYWADDATKRSGMSMLDQYFSKVLSMATGGKVDNGKTPFFVAPLDPDGNINWELVRSTVEAPAIADKASHANPDSLRPGQLVQVGGETGRLYQVQRVRADLKASSAPEPGSREEAKGFASYVDYWAWKHYSHVRDDDLMVETRWMKKHQALSTTLSRISTLASHSPNADMVEREVLLPHSICRPSITPFAIFEVFRTLPSIVRHITDLHRVHMAETRLGLPSLDTVRLVEALTIPASGAGYSFQRLETLGDAVLKGITAVHIFNKFPYRHEGQLDIARSNSVNNTYLLGRAREKNLHNYLIHEKIPPKWRPKDAVEWCDDEWMSIGNVINRKTLPDVMEALIGVSYLKGGLNTALKTATALGLCTGGDLPWEERGYDSGPLNGANTHSTLLGSLEEQLGYSFHNSKLAVEAICHPTFRSDEFASYQRLEYLGDAIIDVYVTQYLFLKYPDATPGQITWAKSRSVCNPVLGTLSVRALNLHKSLLADSPLLITAINEYLEIIKDVPYSRLVVETWAFDPPKPLCDVFEAVIGAVLVDSGFSLGVVFRVLEPIMADVLAVVSPQMPRDPTTELMIWAGRNAACTQVKYRKSASDPSATNAPQDQISVVIHGIDITSPVKESTRSLSKYRASTLALAIVKDESHEFALSKICDCRAVAARKRAEAQALKPPKSHGSDSDSDDEVVHKTRKASAKKSPGPDSGPASKTEAGSDAQAESTTSLQTSLLAHESLTKQPADGDALDFTEDGFRARAEAAAELFANDEQSLGWWGASGGSDGSPMDEEPEGNEEEDWIG